MAEETQIVEAVGASSNTGGSKKSDLGKFVEAVITRAIQEAYDDGIKDTDIIKQRIQAAREAALAFYAREMKRMLELPAAEQKQLKIPTTAELNSQSE